MVDLTFVVINWNSGWMLDRCLPTLLKQDGCKVEVIVIDNDSSDNSLEILEQFKQQVKIVANKENTGYSRAANQGITLSSSRYVSIINPDVMLSPNYGYHIVKKMDENNAIGAATGKLIKYDFKTNKSLDVIDSTGIEKDKGYNMFDRGQNSEDLNYYDSKQHVFGVSGAAPLYRKEALESVSRSNEFFDEDFFAYKEDIDLSWRLNIFNWKCVFVPEAEGYHGRGFGAPVNKGLKEKIKFRRNQSLFLRKLSLRNHYCLLIKNLKLSELNFHIIKNEVSKFGYCLLFETKTLNALFELIPLLPKMLKKRKFLFDNAKKCKFD
ncbi:glycosyltransferase family 2 protein [Halalkalibacter akibai]|uniref:Glycosyltransferase n=1 Tax=Halalkalibacter akibai (strain ATCC 43226 / DSM 21942 / CIP 109018 / JCM 9157 / 1139) TaxID=1236973 RepID=W4QSW8_HALA3|nr:glycosyltransferase family 2 protein [Halalkalibacter akibai]GAE34987.1 glycosyltransferase [Halalkalibacter akibai JCM 9157]